MALPKDFPHSAPADGPREKGRCRRTQGTSCSGADAARAGRRAPPGAIGGRGRGVDPADAGIPSHARPRRSARPVLRVRRGAGPDAAPGSARRLRRAAGAERLHRGRGELRGIGGGCVPRREAADFRSLRGERGRHPGRGVQLARVGRHPADRARCPPPRLPEHQDPVAGAGGPRLRSEEHTSELQSHHEIVCRILLEKKKKKNKKKFKDKKKKNKKKKKKKKK